MRYLMRKRMFAVGGDYWVEDEQGRPVLLVDGKVLRLRKTFVLQDPGGAEVATIRKQPVALRETMEVERGGRVIAKVRKALFAFRDRFDVALADGTSLIIQGNLTDHEYELRRGEQVVAEISKRWFSARDTYAVDVAAGEDVALVLALTVVVDWMTHEEGA